MRDNDLSRGGMQLAVNGSEGNEQQKDNHSDCRFHGKDGLGVFAIWRLNHFCPCPRYRGFQLAFDS
jgi:hypothetical protein